MIPKTIHYFWDGPLPNYSYQHSWKIHCPDYEIKHWNCNNLPFDVDKYKNLKTIIDAKKYSILSDFVRHWALLMYGGFYLDCDVELFQSLDSLRGYKSFTCIEGEPIAGNSAVCGAEPGHFFQAIALDDFFEFDFKKLLAGEYSNIYPPEILVSPCLVTKIIKEYKQGKNLDHTDLSEIKHYSDGFVTLPKQYFYPYNWNETFTPDCIKPETIGIHWWKKSWA